MNLFLKLMPPPAPRSFAERMAGRLRRAGVFDDAPEVDEESFALRSGESSFFLGHLYEECRHLWPWQRRTAEERFVRLAGSAGDVPETWEEAVPRLLPGIRDAFLPESVRLSARLGRREPPSVASRALGTRLVACLVVDAPESMQVVSDLDLARWEKSFSEAFEVATSNLRERTKPGQGMRRVGASVYLSEWGDCYDASRLLLPDVFRGLDLDGDPVALVPSWNHLLIAGEGDPVALGTALRLAATLREQQSRPMSALPLVKKGLVWEQLDLPRGHPCRPLLERTEAVEMAEIYGQQKVLLDAIHEREDDALVTLGCEVAEHRQTGRRRSFSVWTPEDQGALLPESQIVSFYDETILAQLDWDIVVRRVGNLLEPAGLRPPRRRILGFPDEDALAAALAEQRRRGDPWARADG